MDKPAILIVEDDADLAEMLGTFFHGEYEILIAGLGSEALRLSGERDVALVLLDIHLPDIDGYDVCRQLRQQRRTQSVPIIFLTQKRERVDKLHGLELGVVDYITKPFDIQELRLRVRNAITRAERPGSINSVTDLPDADLTGERLTAALEGDQPWAALSVSIGGLAELRAAYGFLAADEVMRAITIMLRSAVHEQNADEDFLGHLKSETLALISTDGARLSALRDRLEKRIQPSLRHFYPPSALEQERSTLTLETRLIDSSAGPFDDPAAVRHALLTVPPGSPV